MFADEKQSIKCRKCESVAPMSVNVSCLIVTCDFEHQVVSRRCTSLYFLLYLCLAPTRWSLCLLISHLLLDRSQPLSTNHLIERTKIASDRIVLFVLTRRHNACHFSTSTQVIFIGLRKIKVSHSY